MHSTARVLFLAAAMFVHTSATHGQLIVAHRGASHDAPENSLSAFRLAWEQGADGIEADFYLSSDGHIVCMHDKDTERTAGVKHVVKDTPLAVLRKLDVGAWKNERFRGEQMPTFDEVAAVVPAGKLFYIELKVGPEIVAPLAKAIKASKLDRRNTVIISFNADTIAECERLLPDIQTQWLVRYEEQPDGRWTPPVDEVIATLKRSKADLLSTKAEPAVVDAAFLEKVRAAGYEDFAVWTVDDAKLARMYRDLGAKAVTTNRPGWLREKLNGAAPKNGAGGAK
jgi:glycerophosphoryl diester phosphodiesterase